MFGYAGSTRRRTTATTRRRTRGCFSLHEIHVDPVRTAVEPGGVPHEPPKSHRVSFFILSDGDDRISGGQPSFVSIETDRRRRSAGRRVEYRHERARLQHASRSDADLLVARRPLLRPRVRVDADRNGRVPAARRRFLRWWPVAPGRISNGARRSTRSACSTTGPSCWRSWESWSFSSCSSGPTSGDTAGQNCLGNDTGTSSCCPTSSAGRYSRISVRQYESLVELLTTAPVAVVRFISRPRKVTLGSERGVQRLVAANPPVEGFGSALTTIRRASRTVLSVSRVTRSSLQNTVRIASFKSLRANLDP